MKNFARVEIASRARWRDWLETHHRQAESVWVVTFKKGRGDAVPYDALVEEALCFGWVDSLPRKLDDARTMLLMSPRKSGSSWSGVNRRRIERMVATGQMADAGLAKVEAAKADGSWNRLDDVEALVVPDDLATALAADPAAEAFFKAFPPSSRRGILEWLLNAKRPATRARRIEDTVRLARDNIKANHPRS